MNGIPALTRNRIVALVILVTLLALTGTWLYRNFEYVTVEDVSYFKGEARHNPLLAASRLLERYEVPVRSQRGIRQKPAERAMVVWGAHSRELHEALREELVDWVERGGHLVVEIGDEAGWGYDGGPLERLGFSLEEVAFDEEDPDLSSTPAGLEIDFSQIYSVGAPEGVGTVLAAGVGRVNALSIVHGEGRLTVLSDMQWLENREIGEHDHAAFFLSLVDLWPRSEVVLVYRESRPSLFDLLMKETRPVLVSAAVLLLLWVWMRSRRFGPMLPELPPGRRRLAEHIDASGRFLWRTGQAEALYHDAKESMLRSLEFRHPGWPESPELAERLAQSSGLEVEAVKIALGRSGPKTPLEFIEAVRDLERIRRSL